MWTLIKLRISFTLEFVFKSIMASPLCERDYQLQGGVFCHHLDLKFIRLALEGQINATLLGNKK